MPRDGAPKPGARPQRRHKRLERALEPTSTRRKAASDDADQIPPLRRSADGPHAWLEHALEAALDAIGTAAFVADKDGHVVTANEAGQKLYLAEGPEGLARAIADGRAGKRARFVVTQLTRDAKGYVLAVKRPDVLSAEERLERAGARFGLSSAQTAVLKLISQGMTNLTVAATLGISERTVETHVTKILTKLLVTSRAAAVAKALADHEGGDA